MKNIYILCGDALHEITIYSKKIDATTWYAFKQMVSEAHGTERGHLNKELTIALKEYIEKREKGVGKFRTIQ